MAGVAGFIGLGIGVTVFGDQLSSQIIIVSIPIIFIGAHQHALAVVQAVGFGAVFVFQHPTAMAIIAVTLLP